MDLIAKLILALALLFFVPFTVGFFLVCVYLEGMIRKVKDFERRLKRVEAELRIKEIR